MIIYIGVLLFDLAIVIGSRFLPKTKKFLILELALFVLPLILICSLKSINVGYDTIQYADIYHSSTGSKLSLYGGVEPGYMALNKIFKMLHAPFFVFLLFVYTLIFGFTAFFCYKKSNNSLLLLFFIIYFGLFGFSISGVRQALAIGVVLFGFSFFEYKKPISLIAVVLTTLLAVTIHKSVLLILPFVILLLFNFNKIVFVIVSLAFIAIGIISPFVYSQIIIDAENYYYPIINESFWTIIIYVLFLVLIIVLSNKKTVNFINRKTDRFDNKTFLQKLSFNATDNTTEYSFSYSVLLACIAFPLLVLFIGNYNPVFSRVNYFLVPFTGLLLINVINSKKMSLLSRDIINYLLIVFVSIYFIYSVLIKNPIGVVPFSFGPIM